MTKQFEIRPARQTFTKLALAIDEHDLFIISRDMREQFKDWELYANGKYLRTLR